MIVIGIETSCDETAVAIVEDGKKVVCNLVASQIDLHREFGGVVPEIASRRHLEVINFLISSALKKSNLSFKDISAVAVTSGPGLDGSLLVGVAVAKTISFALNIPIVEVNHIFAHIYANFKDIEFSPPYVCLVVSGGHTDLFILQEDGKFKLLGRTRDDAAGEALDKAAKVLNLPYPGGPVIDELSQKGKSEFINFPRAYLEKDSFDFSFSGLKTSLIYYLKKNFHLQSAFLHQDVNPQLLSDICASYQKAIIDVLVSKTISASLKFNIKKILLGGGVVSNSKLRSEFKCAEKKYKLNINYPPPELCTDNAVMTAIYGYYKLKEGNVSDLSLDIKPYFDISSM